jgi:hypothetical protein
MQMTIPLKRWQVRQDSKNDFCGFRCVIRPIQKMFKLKSFFYINLPKKPSIAARSGYQPAIPRVRYSAGPLFRGSAIPQVHYSAGPLFRSFNIWKLSIYGSWLIENTLNRNILSNSAVPQTCISAETGSDLTPKTAIPWCRKMAASILKSESTWIPETIWRGLGFSSDSSIETECVRIHGREERIARRPTAGRYDTLPHRSAEGDCPGAMAYVTRDAD